VAGGGEKLFARNDRCKKKVVEGHRDRLEEKQREQLAISKRTNKGWSILKRSPATSVRGSVVLPGVTQKWQPLEGNEIDRINCRQLSFQTNKFQNPSAIKGKRKGNLW